MRQQFPAIVARLAIAIATLALAIANFAINYKTSQQNSKITETYPLPEDG